MTASSHADRCYRHPDRASWVLCSRCGRTICGPCQQQAPVGVRCPDCVRELAQEQRALHQEARVAAGAPRTAIGRRVQQWLGQPAPVTMAIIAVTSLVGLLQLLPGSLQESLLFWAPVSLAEPWRFVTYALLHAGIFHFAFNMLVLWMVGPSIEQSIGRWQFLAAYVVSAVGAAVAIAWLTPNAGVVGASGAIYALFGMTIGMQRMMGRVQPTLLVVVGINLVISFVVGGISWPAHVGGLLIGLALGFGIGIADRRMRGVSAGKAAWLVIGAVAACIAAIFALWVALTL